MKKTKLGAGLLVIITVAATAAAGAAYISRDREGPAIIFDESTQTSYYSGITEEELLDGVRAEDGRDGDVTDSLMVEKVNELGSQAVVTYVAMDSRYNVTKEERILEIDGGSGAEVSPTPTPTRSRKTRRRQLRRRRRSRPSRLRPRRRKTRRRKAREQLRWRRTLLLFRREALRYGCPSTC